MYSLHITLLTGCSNLPHFNKQNASQYCHCNIEETVARMPKSGILGKLQELCGKETKQPYSFKI